MYEKTKILTLAIAALLLNVSVAVAETPSSAWNNSWGFPGPFEKANLLKQAIAIKIAEEDGYSNNFYSTTNTNCNEDGACFFGTSNAIGNQQINLIDGDNNHVEGNTFGNDGNVSSQINNGSGKIHQNASNGNNRNGLEEEMGDEYQPQD